MAETKYPLSYREEAEVKYPFCFYAEYEDGRSRFISGNSEEECICSIVHYEPKRGKCTYYTGVNDDDYVDGEYVGAENFIYE
jgi:hypothetical protein